MEIMELSINIPNNDYLIGRDTKLFLQTMWNSFFNVKAYYKKEQEDLILSNKSYVVLAIESFFFEDRLLDRDGSTKFHLALFVEGKKKMTSLWIAFINSDSSVEEYLKYSLEELTEQGFLVDATDGSKRKVSTSRILQFRFKTHPVGRSVNVYNKEYRIRYDSTYKEEKGESLDQFFLIPLKTNFENSNGFINLVSLCLYTDFTKQLHSSNIGDKNYWKSSLIPIRLWNEDNKKIVKNPEPSSFYLENIVTKERIAFSCPTTTPSNLEKLDNLVIEELYQDGSICTSNKEVMYFTL